MDLGPSNNQVLRPRTTSGVFSGGAGSCIESPGSLRVAKGPCVTDVFAVRKRFVRAKAGDLGVEKAEATASRSARWIQTAKKNMGSTPGQALVSLGPRKPQVVASFADRSGKANGDPRRENRSEVFIRFTESNTLHHVW